MNTYEVVRRQVNIHEGVVQLGDKVAAKFGKNLKKLGDDKYKVIKPIQIPKGVVFGYDGELRPFNVKKTKDPISSEADNGEDNDVIDDERIALIMDAIEQLDPESENDFTKGGLPDVKAIEAVLEEDITAAERDIAWQQLQENNQGQ